MRRALFLSHGCALLLALSAVAFAETDIPPRGRSLEETGELIREGIAAGRITAREAQPLLKQEQQLRERESRLDAGEPASPQAHRRLLQDLDTLHTQVQRALRNRQSVPSEYNRLADLRGLQRRLHARIERGVRFGRLKPSGAEALRRHENQIRRQEQSYLADGVVTRSERESLRGSLAGLEEHIDYLMQGGGSLDEGYEGAYQGGYQDDDPLEYRHGYRAGPENGYSNGYGGR